MNLIINNNLEKFNTRKQITFCSNNTFAELKKDNPQCLTSNFFRFGDTKGVQSKDFPYVVDTLKLAFMLEKKPKILIIGLGNKAQELYSYAVVIKDLFKDKPLSKSVNITCVDLQPEFSKEQLKKLGYLDGASWIKYNFDGWREPTYGPIVPNHAESSFDKIPNSGNQEDVIYRVKNEIDKFCQNVLKRKTFWNTDIVDFSAKTKRKFDIISINNVYYYLSDNEKPKLKNNLTKMVKTNRFLVTEPIANYNKLDTLDDKGIWTKSTREMKGRGPWGRIEFLLSQEQVKENLKRLPDKVAEELKYLAVLK